MDLCELDAVRVGDAAGRPARPVGEARVQRRHHPVELVAERTRRRHLERGVDRAFRLPEGSLEARRASAARDSHRFVRVTR